jgi:hypothetical protein
VEQALEPGELAPVGEDDRPDLRPVDLAVGPDDLLPEALDDCPLDLGVLAEQPVDDLVARDDRCAMLGERTKRR